MASVPTPDFAASVAFLDMALPLGPWQLTAIDPKKKMPPVTRTFYPGDEADMLSWLDKYNDRNLYWAVNPPGQDANKKSAKKDIKQVGYLHADLDPDDKLPLEQAQAKIRKNFDRLPIGENKHPPSFIIFSGNGYQPFWKLAEPFVVDGDPALIERYNIQRAKMFGGDNCHNIDRIMRLPGTVNWPNEQKREKGRVPVLATVYAVSDPMPAYPLGLFTPAPEEVLSSALSGPTVSIDTSNVVRLGDINELDKYGVPDRVKIICVQGKHPDEPKEGDNSRSAFLYDAVCNLLRAGVPDEVIYSVITDPEFGISASVLDKQNVHKYAVKQIEVARTDASPLQGWLSVANEKYAFIKTVGGGKPRVMWTTVTGVRQFQGKDDFRFSLIGESVSIGEKDGKPIVKPLADAWLTSPGRHTYETLAFAPGKTMPDNVFNTWEGWTIDPPPEGANCERFLELTRDVICSGNPVHYAWMLNWMAHRVQRLFEPPQIAVVLRGGGGVGKSFWVKHLGQLFGKKYFAHLSDPDHFLGNFNASLSEKLLVFGDEIFVTRDKKMQSQLKRLVTEETMQVERKGIDTVEEDRYFALMLATNEGWAVPAGVDERRLMVLDVSGCHKEDKAFFKAVQHEWTHGGKEALFALLGKHDISEFEYRERPVTRALVDQMTRSFTGAQRYVYNMLCSGEAPIRAFRDGVADYDLGFTRVEAFVETTPMAEKAKVSGTSMGCALAAICVGGKAGARPTVDGQQRRGAWLLPLHEARSAFAMAMKHELEWPDVDGGWVSSLTLGPEAALAASRQAGTADLPF